MTRSEAFACTAWTIGIAAVLTPLALALGSGHIGCMFGMVGTLIAILVLLPALALSQIVEPVAGYVLGTVAAAAAELASIFAIVYVVRRIRSSTRELN